MVIYKYETPIITILITYITVISSAKSQIVFHVPRSAFEELVDQKEKLVQFFHQLKENI